MKPFFSKSDNDPKKNLANQLAVETADYVNHNYDEMMKKALEHGLTPEEAEKAIQNTLNRAKEAVVTKFNQECIQQDIPRQKV